MFCLDTYALWEISFGNKEFLILMNDNPSITDWTLVEFYRGMLKEYDKKTADYWLEKLKPYYKNVDINILIRAVLFQEENKKRRLSLFDCVGYIYAQENNMKFVTGDKEFKEMKGVLFIK